MPVVKVLIGDLFSSDAQTLVNTVNTVGVMGKGIALEFKRRFPEMYADYVARFERRELKLGEPYLYASLMDRWVINFPTKANWRSVSRLEDITHGLDFLEAHYKGWGIKSLAVPPLGCGQGQLDWSLVGPTLYRHLNRLDIPVELYAPYGTPEVQLTREFLAGSTAVGGSAPTKINPAWLAVVEILRRVEREPYRWPIGRVGFQKLAYFATEAGIPTGLSFVPGSFGPFSPDLKRITSRLVNNGLISEEQRGRMIAVRTGRTFQSASQANEAMIRRWDDEIDLVTDLVLRMTTTDAEIAATVHFSAKVLHGRGVELPTEHEVFREVMRWKQRRKPPLDEKKVADTIRHLAILGWIQVKASADLPVSSDFDDDDQLLAG